MYFIEVSDLDDTSTPLSSYDLGVIVSRYVLYRLAIRYVS